MMSDFKKPVASMLCLLPKGYLAHQIPPGMFFPMAYGSSVSLLLSSLIGIALRLLECSLFELALEEACPARGLIECRR